MIFSQPINNPLIQSTKTPKHQQTLNFNDSKIQRYPNNAHKESPILKQRLINKLSLICDKIQQEDSIPSVSYYEEPSLRQSQSEVSNDTVDSNLVNRQQNKYKQKKQRAKGQTESIEIKEMVRPNHKFIFYEVKLNQKIAQLHEKTLKANKEESAKKQQQKRIPQFQQLQVTNKIEQNLNDKNHDHNIFSSPFQLQLEFKEEKDISHPNIKKKLIFQTKQSQQEDPKNHKKAPKQAVKYYNQLQSLQNIFKQKNEYHQQTSNFITQNKNQTNTKNRYKQLDNNEFINIQDIVSYQDKEDNDEDNQANQKQKSLIQSFILSQKKVKIEPFPYKNQDTFEPTSKQVQIKFDDLSLRDYFLNNENKKPHNISILKSFEIASTDKQSQRVANNSINQIRNKIRFNIDHNRLKQEHNFKKGQSNLINEKLLELVKKRAQTNFSNRRMKQSILIRNLFDEKQKKYDTIQKNQFYNHMKHTNLILSSKLTANYVNIKSRSISSRDSQMAYQNLSQRSHFKTIKYETKPRKISDFHTINGNAKTEINEDSSLYGQHSSREHVKQKVKFKKQRVKMSINNFLKFQKSRQIRHQLTGKQKYDKLKQLLQNY